VPAGLPCLRRRGHRAKCVTKCREFLTRSGVPQGNCCLGLNGQEKYIWHQHLHYTSHIHTIINRFSPQTHSSTTHLQLLPTISDLYTPPKPLNYPITMSFTSSTISSATFGCALLDRSSASTTGQMTNQGRGGYNRGPDDDDEPEDGRGGYN
jgi:hypothetical protein